jgi:CheY-like chemotaxis protein
MRGVEVLIVEDDDAIRAVLAALLEDAGYTVFMAPDGRPALERLRTHPEGLVVLLDLNMPGMDGYALLQAVAAEPHLATQHVYILMSATANMLPPQVAQLTKQLQMTALHKPFHLEEALAVVEKAVNRLA